MTLPYNSQSDRDTNGTLDKSTMTKAQILVSQSPVEWKPCVSPIDSSTRSRFHVIQPHTDKEPNRCCSNVVVCMFRLENESLPDWCAVRCTMQGTNPLKGWLSPNPLPVGWASVSSHRFPFPFLLPPSFSPFSSSWLSLFASIFFGFGGGFSSCSSPSSNGTKTKSSTSSSQLQVPSAGFMLPTMVNYPLYSPPCDLLKQSGRFTNFTEGIWKVLEHLRHLITFHMPSSVRPGAVVTLTVALKYSITSGTSLSLVAERVPSTVL